jgi:hypothetical protein
VKRIILLITVALVMATMTAITPSNAFADEVCGVDTGTGEPIYCPTDDCTAGCPIPPPPCPLPNEHAGAALEPTTPAPVPGARLGLDTFCTQPGVTHAPL